MSKREVKPCVSDLLDEAAFTRLHVLCPMLLSLLSTINNIISEVLGKGVAKT